MAESSLEPSQRWGMPLKTRQRAGTWVCTPVNVAEPSSTGKTAVAP